MYVADLNDKSSAKMLSMLRAASVVVQRSNLQKSNVLKMYVVHTYIYIHIVHDYDDHG